MKTRKNLKAKSEKLKNKIKKNSILIQHRNLLTPAMISKNGANAGNNAGSGNTTVDVDNLLRLEQGTAAANEQSQGTSATHPQTAAGPSSAAAHFDGNKSQQQSQHSNHQQQQQQLPSLHSDSNERVKTTANTTRAGGGHNLSTAPSSSESSAAQDLSSWADLCRTCGKPGVDLATLFNNNNSNKENNSNNNQDGLSCSDQRTPPAETSTNLPVNQSTKLQHAPESSAAAATLSSSSSAEAASDSAAFGDQSSSFMDAILQEMQIWNLRIKQDDGLPQRICPKCRAQFSMIGKFRRKCLKVQIRLRTLNDEFQLQEQKQEEKEEEHREQKQQPQEQKKDQKSAHNVTTTPGEEMLPPPTKPRSNKNNTGEPTTKAQALERLLPDIGTNFIKDKHEARSSTATAAVTTAPGIKPTIRRRSRRLSEAYERRNRTTSINYAIPPMSSTTFDDEAMLETHVIFKTDRHLNEQQQKQQQQNQQQHPQQQRPFEISFKLATDTIVSDTAYQCDYTKFIREVSQESSMLTPPSSKVINSSLRRQASQESSLTASTTNTNSIISPRTASSALTSSTSTTFVTKAALKEYDISPIGGNKTNNSPSKGKQSKRKSSSSLSVERKRRNTEIPSGGRSSPTSSNSAFTTHPPRPQTADIIVAENKLEEHPPSEVQRCGEEPSIKPCSIRLRSLPSAELEAINKPTTRAFGCGNSEVTTIDAMLELAARDFCNSNLNNRPPDHDNYEAMMTMMTDQAAAGHGYVEVKEEEEFPEQVLCTPAFAEHDDDNEETVMMDTKNDENENRLNAVNNAETEARKSSMWLTKATLRALLLSRAARKKTPKSESEMQMAKPKEGGGSKQVKIILERKRGARYKCKPTATATTAASTKTNSNQKRQTKGKRRGPKRNQSVVEATEEANDPKSNPNEMVYSNTGSGESSSVAWQQSQLRSFAEICNDHQQANEQSIGGNWKEGGADNEAKAEMRHESFGLYAERQQNNGFAGDNNSNNSLHVEVSENTGFSEQPTETALKRKLSTSQDNNATSTDAQTTESDISSETKKTCQEDRSVEGNNVVDGGHQTELKIETESEKGTEIEETPAPTDSKRLINFEVEAHKLAKLFAQKVSLKEQSSRHSKRREPKLIIRIPYTYLSEDFKRRHMQIFERRKRENVADTERSVETVVESEAVSVEEKSTEIVQEENTKSCNETTTPEDVEARNPEESPAIESNINGEEQTEAGDTNGDVETNESQSEEEEVQSIEPTTQSEQISEEEQPIACNRVEVFCEADATTSTAPTTITATENHTELPPQSAPITTTTTTTTTPSNSKINDFINDFQMNCIDSTDLESRANSPTSIMATIPITALTATTATTETSTAATSTQMEIPNVADVVPQMSASTNQEEIDEVETTLNGILSEMQDQHIYTPVSNHTDDFFSSSVYSPFSDSQDTPLGPGSIYADSPATSIGGGIGGSSMNEASSPYMMPSSSNHLTPCYDHDAINNVPVQVATDENTTQSELIGFQNDIPCFENIEMTSTGSIKSGGEDSSSQPPNLTMQPECADTENVVFLNGDPAKESELQKLLEDFEATERELTAEEPSVASINLVTPTENDEVATQWTNEETVSLQSTEQQEFPVPSVEAIQEMQPTHPTVQQQTPTTFYINGNPYYATTNAAVQNPLQMHNPQQLTTELPKSSTDSNSAYLDCQHQQQQHAQHQQQHAHQKQQQIMIVIPQDYIDKNGGSNAPRLQPVYTTAPQQQQHHHQQQQPTLQYQQQIHPQALQQTAVLAHQQRPQYVISPRITHINNQQPQFYMTPTVTTVNGSQRIQYYPTASTFVPTAPSVVVASPPVSGGPRPIQPSPVSAAMQQQQLQQQQQQQHQMQLYQQSRSQRPLKVSLTCRFCHKKPKFTNNLDYSNHIIALHPEQKPFNCPHCPMHFVRRTQRQQHITEVHGAKRFQCAQCGESFAAQRTLDSHLQRAHAPEGQSRPKRHIQPAPPRPRQQQQQQQQQHQQQPHHQTMHHNQQQQMQQQQHLTTQLPYGSSGGGGGVSGGGGSNGAACALSVRQQQAPWSDSGSNHSSSMPDLSPAALVRVEDVHLHVSDESSHAQRAIDIHMDTTVTNATTADTQAYEPQALCSSECDNESSEATQQSNDVPMISQEDDAQTGAEEDGDGDEEVVDDASGSGEAQIQHSMEQQQPPMAALPTQSRLPLHVTMPSPEQTEPDSTTTLRCYRRRRGGGNGSKQQTTLSMQMDMPIQAPITTTTTTTSSSSTTPATTSTTSSAADELKTNSGHCLLRYNHNCQYCEEQFPNEIALRKHILLAHGNHMTMPYVCAICKRGFRMRTALQRHMDTHEAVGRPYECNECHVRFPRPSHLSLHKVTVHSLVKPHACQICGKQFCTESAVKTHMKFHGEKKIPCDMCERRFFLRKDMRKHRRSVHFGVLFYKCDFCPSSFLHHSRFAAHMKTHIPDGMYIEEDLPSNVVMQQQNSLNNNTNNANNNNNNNNYGSCAENVEQSKLIGDNIDPIAVEVAASNHHHQLNLSEFEPHQQQAAAGTTTQHHEHEQHVDYGNLIMPQQQ